MKATNFGNHLHPSLEQLHRNTSLWIGHMNAGPTDHLAGQTFYCPEDGSLKKIQVYSSAVSHPGKIILTLHDFEKQRKNWGNILSSSEIEIDENDNENWMQFPLHSIELNAKENASSFHHLFHQFQFLMKKEYYPNFFFAYQNRARLK